MGGLSNSAIVVGEQEVRLSEVAETADFYHVICSYMADTQTLTRAESFKRVKYLTCQISD